MKKILENSKDFKIIPSNFKSSGEFEVLSIDECSFTVKLKLSNKEELNDYKKGENVEIFAANSIGLVYFDTLITRVSDEVLTLALTQDYSVIQRREYSRVPFSEGKIIFKDMPENIVEKTEDISAGGIKFIANQSLSTDRIYDVEITLTNNMKIECSIQPLRIASSDSKYTISAKFVNLQNADRVILVQYAFKMKMENRQ